MKLLKEDVLTFTRKPGEQSVTLTASWEQAEKIVGELKNETDTSIQGVGESREGKKRAEYDRGGLRANLQRTHCERKKCSDAVNRVQSDVSKVQEPVN